MATKKTKKTKKASKKAKQRDGVRPEKWLSDIELKHLRENLKGDATGSSRHVMNRFLVELLVSSGLRASEVCDLNIGDLPVSHGKRVILVRNGKGNVSRSVDIGPTLEDEITKFVQRHRVGAGSDDPLLMSEQGRTKSNPEGRMKYRSVYAKIKGIGKRCGLGKLHPHVLRHTFLKRLYNQEHDLLFVQDQAGHASPTTTAIYAKTDDAGRKRQMAALDKLDQDQEGPKDEKV